MLPGQTVPVKCRGEWNLFGSVHKAHLLKRNLREITQVYYTSSFLSWSHWAASAHKQLSEEDNSTAGRVGDFLQQSDSSQSPLVIITSWLADLTGCFAHDADIRRGWAGDKTYVGRAVPHDKQGQHCQKSPQKPCATETKLLPCQWLNESNVWSAMSVTSWLS